MMRRRAFTLLELLVVVAIIVLLSAVALPRLLSMTPLQRVQAAARELASDLRWARQVAVTGAAPDTLDVLRSIEASQVHVIAGGTQYLIEACGPKLDGGPWCVPVRTVSMPVVEGRPLRLSSSIDRLRFISNGVTTAPAIMTIEDPGASLRRSVTVTRAGLVRIE